MKEPKLSDVEVDEAGTKKLRKQMSKVNKVKITIHFDADLVGSLKQISRKTGIPYQTLANRLLREAIQKNEQRESRLDRVEKELEKLKKKIAAKIAA
ncbi:MAG: BrnA antitoxin family protein [Deltaproteobacteria bacterium]|nr:BrnA antitoxin family protein [Deltaproteobacteria bacterium]